MNSKEKCPPTIAQAKSQSIRGIYLFPTSNFNRDIAIFTRLYQTVNLVYSYRL